MAMKYTVVVMEYDDEKAEAPRGRSAECNNPLQLSNTIEMLSITASLMMAQFTDEELEKMDEAGAMPNFKEVHFHMEGDDCLAGAVGN